MKTEKNQIEIEENQPVDKSRRRAIGAGIAAPVIMTLASKPVFAVQGLSNMMSGNTSQQKVRGDCYYGGFSHGWWMFDGKNDKGKITHDMEKDQHGLSWMRATGASTYAAASSITVQAFFTAAGCTTYPHSGTLLEAIKENGTDASQIVSGLLNYYYYANGGKDEKSGETGRYFLTLEQFRDLNDGFPGSKWKLPNGYSSFADLIESNMHGQPGTC
jgi:hypothetical protein